MSFVDGSIRSGHDDHIVMPQIMCNACGKNLSEEPYGLCRECKYSWIYTGGAVVRKFNEEICSDPNCNHHDGAHVTYGLDYKTGQPLRVCTMFDYKKKEFCCCRDFKKKEIGIIVRCK